MFYSIQVRRFMNTSSYVATFISGAAYKTGVNSWSVLHLNSYPIKDWTEFNVYGSVHHKNILIYIQQDATLHSLFYLETALHVSGGQERKQLYLQQLVFVRPLLLPAASGR